MVKNKNEKKEDVIEVKEVEVKNTNLENKKNKSNIVLPIVIVLVILIIGACVFMIITGSPKRIFTQNINKGYSKISEILNENEEYFKNPINLESDLKIDTNIKELKELAAYDYGLDFLVDPKNNETHVSLEVLENDKSLLNVLYYYINNQFYYKYNNVVDKLIKVSDFVSPVETKKIDPTDIDYLGKEIINSLNNNLNEKNFSKTSEKLDIDGKTLNTKKITYNLDAKSLKDLTDNIIDDLLNNNKFLDKASEVFGISKDEVKTMLKDAKNEDFNLEVDMKINLYVKGIFNEFVGIDFEVSTAKIFYYMNKDYYEFGIKEDSTPLNLKVTANEDKDITTFKLKLNGLKLGTLELNNKEDDKVTAKLDIDFFTLKILSNLEITQNAKNDQVIDGKIKFDFEMDDSTTVNKFNLDWNYKLTENIDMPKVDTKNAIEEKDLTKDDQTKIEKAFANLKFITNLLK